VQGTNNDTLIEVRDLQTHFHTEEGVARAVDGVSWSIRRGETLALVGESGCGKSVTALSIMRLVPDPPGKIVGGSVRLRDRELLELTERDMRDVRGNRIAMIFQEPMTSLNPVYSIGSQIVEAIELHQDLKGAAAFDHAALMLQRVGIGEPRQRLREYPHQMSGGMRQRVMIAMALSCNPDLLIADEPTTALDVTIQAQILQLLKQLQAKTQMAILLITHDLGVVAEVADRVAVMYAGKIVELADVEELYKHPLHPYTQGLLRCVPKLSASKDRLDVIPGHVPNPLSFPSGCKFHPRCPLGHDDQQCRQREPQLEELRPKHWVACWKAK
jgi:oligopeptide transport system ATP-binding protein